MSNSISLCVWKKCWT